MRINLDKLTLVLVDGCDPDLSHKSLCISSRNADFHSILLFSFKRPEILSSNIKFIEIEKLDWMGYNKFIVHRLAQYIESPFCLVSQTDGFVLNADKWTDEFLEYDYIGAPWLIESIHKFNYKNVGNGGFSLRSKKFLELSVGGPAECTGPEDVHVCYTHKKYFQDNGMKYAPIEVALKFSQDPVPNLNDTFGFHGDKHIINKFTV